MSAGAGVRSSQGRTEEEFGSKKGKQDKRRSSQAGGARVAARGRTEGRPKSHTSSPRGWGEGGVAEVALKGEAREGGWNPFRRTGFWTMGDEEKNGPASSSFNARGLRCRDVLQIWEQRFARGGGNPLTRRRRRGGEGEAGRSAGLGRAKAEAGGKTSKGLRMRAGAGRGNFEGPG